MKTYSFLAIVIFVCLSLIPPINFIISNPPHEYWLWIVLIAGFFGVFTLTISTNFTLKLIAIGSFILCFFSSIPYLSFTAYVPVVVCCYFYILCTRIEDWTMILKAGQALVVFNLLVIFMQLIGHDPLLNFGKFHVEQFGTIGQHMQMGSLSVILSAILISFNPLNFIFPLLVGIICHSSWTFLCAGIGIFTYLYNDRKFLSKSILAIFISIFIIWGFCTNKFYENTHRDSSRLVVWQKTIEIANKKPWTGWGIGTYKDLFHVISGLDQVPYRNAHNFVLQLLFEVGYPATGCLLFALGGLLWALYTGRLWLPLSGAVMIISDAMVHMPDRMIQTVPLIILFLALCQFQLRRLEQ